MQFFSKTERPALDRSDTIIFMEEQETNPQTQDDAEGVQNQVLHSLHSSPKPPLNTKLLVWIVIFLGVLVAVGAGAYFYAYQNEPEQIACTLEAKICPDGSAVGRMGPNCEFAECPGESGSPSTSSGQSEIDISDWKTYRNKEYGFEFRYPKEWGVYESLSSKKDYSNVIFYVIGDNVGRIMFEMWLGTKNEVEEPQEYIKNEKELIEANQFGSTLYKTTYYSDVTEQLRIHLHIITSSGEMGWARYYYFPSNQEEASNFQFILSTFKFIE